MKDFDIVIVGAGPAGCVAARDLARGKVSVGLFDARGRGALGKPIVIEVEKGIFPAAGIRPPRADEIPYAAKTVRVFSPRGKESCVIRKEMHAVSVFFDTFVERLFEDAEAAGAKFFGGHQAVKPIVADGRVQGVSFKTRRGQGEVRARLVIDATGFDAALVRALGPEMGFAFEEKKSDIVIAANTYNAIDPDLARKAVREGVQGDEEVWNVMSTHGPYSTEFTYLSLARERAYVLIGFKAEYGGTAPAQRIADYQSRRGYFRELVRGGGGPIRIAHSLDRLVADGFLAVGEAACQVIPIHASGVSTAILAGRLAAKAAAKALAACDTSAKALWPYARDYQRTRGALLAAYDVSRLVTEKMTVDQLGRMFEYGIVNEEDFTNATVPQLKFSPRFLAMRLAGLARNPDLAGPVAKVAWLSAAVKKHYEQYPERFDLDDFYSWRKKAKSLFDRI